MKTYEPKTTAKMREKAVGYGYGYSKDTAVAILTDLTSCESRLAEAEQERDQAWNDAERLRGVIEGWHHTVKQYVSLDEMLDCCRDDECTICGILACPERDPLHFHHDGCPACSQQLLNSEGGGRT
jgi:hypothetical protein